ncbi:hypothetical protein LIER_26336 [Lithospermum erythrorhizon]|uniref:Uncharacterized protein n=1 Tax=Lithospermum erythrorhizon TaxID=34254 RepID=A0AAV3RB76_LITER
MLTSPLYIRESHENGLLHPYSSPMLSHLLVKESLFLYGSYLEHYCDEAFTPPKRSKSASRVKFASLSSSPPSFPLSFERLVMALMSHMPSSDKAAHDALLPLLNQGVVQRVTRLASGPQASYEASRLWLQAASASRALVDGNSTLYQQTLELGEELSQEHLKVEALEQKPQGLRLQAAEASHHPSELAWLARDLKRAEEERDAAYQAARTARLEREGLRHAYCQNSLPYRCSFSIAHCPELSEPGSNTSYPSCVV